MPFKEELHEHCQGEILEYTVPLLKAYTYPVIGNGKYDAFLEKCSKWITS